MKANAYSIRVLKRADCIWRSLLLFAILSGGSGSLPLFAQEESKAPSANFNNFLNFPAPDVSLPKNVVAPEGKLTLFADFDATDGRGVPLYLVNRTFQKVSLSAQDSDIYVKLEYRRKDGVWERAQVHVGSDCGNSYVNVDLPPRQYFNPDFPNELPS